MTTKETTMQNMKDAAKESATENKMVKHKSTLSAVRDFIANENVIKRFGAALQKNPTGFLSSIVSLVSSNTNFDNVDPNTIMMGAMQAATLDLPINPNLGFAHIIPYSGKAQFQMGWKGFVQLALRTGQYQTLNATEIYEGELISRNRLSGEIVFDESKKTSEKIIGYVAFFRLINGFEKSLYMSVEELKAHGKRYSKSYDKVSGPWKSNTHAMMLKTVMKLLLSKYGILSVQMQQAIESDQAVVKETEEGEIVYEYVDNDNTGSETENVLEDDSTPTYWLAKIDGLTSAEECDKFEKAFAIDIQAKFEKGSPKDFELITKALIDKRESFSKLTKKK